jgi:hypothetical protein
VSDAEIRKAVLECMPQAYYMDLSNMADGVCHAIDDDYNDRYLAMGCSSRKAAWRAAYKFLKLGAAPGREKP